MLKTLLIIGSGGFLGSVSRFLVSKYVHVFWPTYFPLGTLLVNISGCFLIGLIYGMSERTNLFNSDLRLFLTIGFCGGFTTFSTFANENITLLRDSEYFYFILYTSLSVILGLSATFIGNLIIKHL